MVVGSLLNRALPCGGRATGSCVGADGFRGVSRRFDQSLSMIQMASLRHGGLAVLSLLRQISHLRLNWHGGLFQAAGLYDADRRAT